MPKQLLSFRKIFSFPYLEKYETDYERSLVLRWYKPLLIVVVSIMMFICLLIAGCILIPGMVDPSRLAGTISAHIAFLLFTMVCVILSVLFRKQLLLYPNRYILLCNVYAIGICIWGMFITAYISMWDNSLTALVYIFLCSSLFSQFKPITAIFVYGMDCCLYILVESLTNGKIPVWDITNVILASGLSSIFAIGFYHYRANNFYNTFLLERRNREIDRMNDKLRLLVYTDNLTGAYNRRYLDEVLPDKLQEVYENGKRPFIAMIDIDKFKDYNDRYGHQEGDICLRKVAESIEAIFEEDGYFVRYGGEEFLLLLQVESTADAEKYAEAARMAVMQQYIEHHSSKYGVVTVSIGFAIGKESDDRTLPELIALADKVLYRAKEKGGNRVEQYE